MTFACSECGCESFGVDTSRSADPDHAPSADALVCRGCRVSYRVTPRYGSAQPFLKPEHDP